jgi:alpha-aminoadipate carrier protein LysW
MKVCPDCENTLSFDEDEVEEGEIILCDECGTEFEVVGTDPVELARVEEHAYDENALSFNDEEEE